MGKQLSTQSAKQPEAAAPMAVARLDSRSLVTRMAARYGVDAEKFLSTLKATAFRGERGQEISNEQLMALLVVAEAHGLNPWLKEIYAFPDQKGGIQPVIGVDGFIKIANTHPQFTGMSFKYDDEGQWVECIIERKDRTTNTVIREYLVECKRNTQPWQQWPQRMLRHRAIAQCVRVAFGFAGIMEDDEADAYIEGQVKDVTPRGKPHTREPQAIDAPPASAGALPAAQPGQTAVSLADELKAQMDRTGYPEADILDRCHRASLEELTDDERRQAIERIKQAFP